MMMMDANVSFDDLVKAVWTDDVLVSAGENEMDKLDSLAKNEMLVREGIHTYNQGFGKVLFTRTLKPQAEKKPSHIYHLPDFTDNVMCLLKDAMNGNGSCNIRLVGPAGSGKSEFVREVAEMAGYGKVYQVNGSDALTPADFYGSLGVEVDKASGQNYTVFHKGALYNAFIEGTKVDADGNQVLDADGNPIVVGKPAIFFLDEYASMLSEVFLGIFNRVMEIPRLAGQSRTMEVSTDNNRIVKSHPAFAMFLAGNTVGKGNNGRFEMGYSAQSNRMDESTLNRITATYTFGYDKEAEMDIASRILNDDYEVARVMEFKDKVRSLFRNDKVESLFTTRTLVRLCHTANSYRRGGMKDWMPMALKDTEFNSLSETDKQAYNETARLIYGIDLMASGNNSRYDFF